MKHKNIDQLKTLLFKSNCIYINSRTNEVNFIGYDLEKCSLKLPNDVINDIIKVCKILEIEHNIY